MRWIALLMTTILLGACAGLGGAPMQAPNVSLVDLRVTEVKLFEQRYGMELRVQNPNSVALPIVGMEYSVRLNDVEFGKGVSRAPVTVPPYGEAVIQVDLVSSTLSLLQRVRELQRGRLPEALKVVIAGGVSLAHAAEPLPFMFQGEIGRAPSRGDTPTNP
jgi:LEA14-like dessication related protein